jgi:hypothetical protein
MSGTSVLPPEADKAEHPLMPYFLLGSSAGFTYVIAKGPWP